MPSYPRRAAAYLATGSLPPPPSLRSIVSLWAMGVTAGGAFLAILGLAVMP